MINAWNRRCYKKVDYFIIMQKIRPAFLGDKLKSIRLESGLTQTELGKRVGLSRRMVLHYEKYATNPPADKVALIAAALGVKIEALLKEIPASKKTNIDPKFARKLEKAKSLPLSDRQLLETMIDSLLKKNKKSRQ